MDVLATIMAERRAAVSTARAAVPEARLVSAAESRVHHSLADRLRARTGTAIIAEVKKASPSAGLLRAEYAPATIAARYAEVGAIGISVLTEPNYFQGSGADLRRVRAAVDVPVLRKDFICDPYQILEAAAWGADVILLIAAALQPQELLSLYREAVGLGLDVLAEVHNRAELESVLPLEKALIGVNSRNLKTLRTDLRIARELVCHIPAARLRIAESGIKTRPDIEDLQQHGYDGFLIGESLLRETDPAAALRRLMCG
ncbi:MAG: indole-3-glycerol phosphate synthase TrpC [Kiritimatiellia bacterium]